MEALLDETEELLAQSLKAQVSAAIPTTVAGLESFDENPFWQQLADGDLLGLGLPPDVGGMGTVFDSTIVLSALGRSLAPVPYLSSVLSGRLLAATGVADALIGDMVSGRRRVAVAFATDLSRPAAVDEEGVAFDSIGADVALKVDADGGVFVVGIGDDREALDLTRRLACVVAGQEGERVGVVSPDALQRWTAVASIAVSADLLGVMTGALDLAVEHARTRVQFGGPIGRFQAVQHLLADSHVDAEGARSLVSHAAWAVDNADLAAAVTAAHVAKAYCSEKGKLVCERVIQVHGGMGMTWECPAHLFHRRAMTDRALMGDESVQYRAIAAGPDPGER